MYALLTDKMLEGVNCNIDHEKQLRVFLEDGEVPLDKNATEGALGNFCLHKHTRKQIDTIERDKASALIYILTGTAPKTI